MLRAIIQENKIQKDDKYEKEFYLHDDHFNGPICNILLYFM